MNSIIEARNVCMDFAIGDGSIVHALKGINLQIPPNRLSVLRGRSGSGKTTLINILGALDRPTSGEVMFLEDGRDITKLPDKERDRLRRVDMAFVFQSVALISTMTAFENVEFALRLTKLPYKERVERARQSLIQVGLEKRMNHRPGEMSGGEQQRVAIDGELLLETAEQGIFTFSDGVVLSGEVTELHSRSSDFSLLYHLGNLRSKAAERFDRIGGDEAELCKGLVLGIKDGFSYELRRDILQSGVSYMTAVSGAHITIFIAVLCELFGKRRRRLTSIVSFAAVLLMMAMFGFSASVVRSGIMLMITQSLCSAAGPTS